jgi:hypothetical protein
MDAVILAAGRGTRMSGLARPFYKPLLEVDGRTLIEHAWSYAYRADADRIVVVASPENLADLQAVLPDEVRFVVQVEPTGPADAVALGLSACTDERVMVLMSDNLMGTEAITYMAGLDCDSVGVKFVPRDQAERFTRVPVPGRFIEGPWTLDDIDNNGHVIVWCGPIVARRQALLDVVTTAPSVTIGGEHKLGPLLGSALVKPRLVACDSIDVGVPEAYAQVTA